MAHQAKTNITDCGRLFLANILYTIHTVNKQLLKLTDGQERMLRTLRMNIVDEVNRPTLKMIKVFSNGWKEDHGY